MTGSPELARSVSSKAYPLLEEWSAEVRRTMENATRHQVHDLRVASRRLGQMIAVLEEAPGASTGKIRRRLKETIRLAGAVRDYDIAQKLVAKFAAPARLRTRLRLRREKAAKELVAALRRLKDRGVAEKWREKIPPRNGAFSAAKRQLLLKAAERLFARAANLDHGPRALHKLRIAAKKLRYTMEMLPFPPARLDPIKQLQSKLGDVNDYESARRLIRKEGASKKLLKNLKEAQQKKTKQFRRYWKHEFARKERGWIALVTHPVSATVKSSS